MLTVQYLEYAFADVMQEFLSRRRWSRVDGQVARKSGIGRARSTNIVPKGAQKRVRDILASKAA